MHHHHEFDGRGKPGRRERLEAALHAHRDDFGPGFGPGPFPGGFGPRFGRMGHPGGPRRPKGDVRAAILAILAGPETPSLNGYGIMKAISEQTEGVWSPSPGSVYPTLQQLVDEGLISPTGEGRKTDYALTDEGRAYAQEHAEELGAWADAQRPSDASRAMMENVGKLMAVVGQFRFAATETQRAQAAAKLEELRKALYLILAE